MDLCNYKFRILFSIISLIILVILYFNNLYTEDALTIIFWVFSGIVFSFGIASIISYGILFNFEYCKPAPEKIIMNKNLIITKIID
jgi:hypothetical protein